MTELSQEVLQEFSDQVAEICENMGLEPGQMREAIGSTFIGAVMHRNQAFSLFFPIVDL